MAGAPAASAARVSATFFSTSQYSWPMSVPPGNSACARSPTRWPRSKTAWSAGAGDELRRLRLVHAPPELLQALEAVAVAGLGERIGTALDHGGSLSLPTDTLCRLDGPKKVTEVRHRSCCSHGGSVPGS